MIETIPPLDQIIDMGKGFEAAAQSSAFVGSQSLHVSVPYPLFQLLLQQVVELYNLNQQAKAHGYENAKDLIGLKHAGRE